MQFLREFILRWLRSWSAAHQSPAPAPPSPTASPASDPPVRLEIEHHVLATSFADPADVAAFRRCKSRGGSDQDCFKIGDNGIGFFGDDTTGSVPMCALPPEDLIERWGSIAAAKHKQVAVAASLRDAPPLEIICLLGDTMPHRAHITNGAGIDLNPAAIAKLKLSPPVMIRAAWRWVV